VVGDHVLFIVDRDDQRELWRANSTKDGAERVTILPEHAHPVATTLSHLFLQADRELWRSDGTADGTFALTDSYQERFVPAGDRLFFLRPLQDDSGTELWVTDGTVDGTQLVQPIEPVLSRGFGCGGPQIQNMTSHGGHLYFSAYDSAGNPGLWKSNGTAEGTVEILKGHFVPLSSGQDVLYLQGQDEATGRELWQTDGTREGTALVYDLNPGPGHSRDEKYRATGTVAEVNGHLYFTGDDGFHGEELWQLPLPSIPGDADGNRVVDFADFAVFAGNYGRTRDVAFADGDFDGNGRIDFADLVMLAQNYSG
jgi:ELWxxDGT repeat protein